MYPDFIIFGAGNYNSLGVLHAIAVAGIDCFILCTGKSKDWKNGNIIGHSRYARYVKEVESPLEGVEWLIANRSLFPKQTVIYPTGDKEEIALDSHYEELSKHFIFPACSSPGRVSQLMNKRIQTYLAMEAGLRILKSQYSNSDDFSFADVSYPCMVKPLNSTEGSKGDMKICENENDLKSALNDGKHTKEFIVQQYIKNEADLLFLGISYPNGSVEIPALVKKPGVSPTGEYTHAIITTDVGSHLPEIHEVKKFVKSLNYTGPFSIEFGLEKEKNYFFEINLRNDGTSHYPLKAGVNIPYSFYRSVKGEKYSFNSKKIEYEMIDEVGDLRRVIGKEISFKNWINSFRNAGTYRFYRKPDNKLKPWIYLMFTKRFSNKLLRIFSK